MTGKVVQPLFFHQLEKSAADTEVGEQHLPEVRVDLLPVLKHRQPHIPQAQALELPAQAVIPQRHQRALKVRHRMPRFPGHSVPLSCGAGGGVTDAAGGKDYRPGIRSLLSRSLLDHASAFA